MGGRWFRSHIHLCWGWCCCKGPGHKFGWRGIVREFRIFRCRCHRQWEGCWFRIGRFPSVCRQWHRIERPGCCLDRSIVGWRPVCRQGSRCIDRFRSGCRRWRRLGHLVGCPRMHKLEWSRERRLGCLLPGISHKFPIVRCCRRFGFLFGRRSMSTLGCLRPDNFRCHRGTDPSRSRHWRRIGNLAFRLRSYTLGSRRVCRLCCFHIDRCPIVRCCRFGFRIDHPYRSNFGSGRPGIGMLCAGSSFVCRRGWPDSRCLLCTA